MQLTNTQCQKAKPSKKAYKLTDGDGLYLEVMPSGKKYWRWQYRYGGKRPRLSFGKFPDVSIAEARDLRDFNRKLIRGGEDPAFHKRKQKTQAILATAATFEAIAREWLDLNRGVKWTDETADAILRNLKKDVFPHIGKVPISNLDAPEILLVVRRIEARGATFLAGRTLTRIGQVFRYSVATGRAKYDPTPSLRGALKTHVTEHLAAISYRELPEFVTKLESNQARLFRLTVLATKFQMLTFVRTNELIKAEISEFHFDDKMWIIPGEKMKMRKDHLVPLSDQSLKIVKEVISISRESPYLFHHFNDPRKHMSKGTVPNALKRMGYEGRMTAHGFRALAMSTIKEKLAARSHRSAAGPPAKAEGGPGV